MRSDLRYSGWVLATFILVILLALPPSLRAQQHVVSSADIRKELVNATQTRQQNRDKVRELFSSKAAQNALKKAGIDPGQVETGISTLSDTELARLAARADRAQADFAAGRISDRDLIIILVVIAVITLIIVAVENAVRMIFCAVPAFIRVEPVQVHVRTDWLSGRPREITWGTNRLPITTLNSLVPPVLESFSWTRRPLTQTRIRSRYRVTVWESHDRYAWRCSLVP